MAKEATPTGISATELLKSLDLDALTARADELQKELDATNVLIKAASIAIHGKPPRKTREPKKDKRSDAVAAIGSSDPPKVKIAKYLRQVGAAQVKTIAGDLRLKEAEVSDMVQNDAAFESRGGGYWRLH